MNLHNISGEQYTAHSIAAVAAATATGVVAEFHNPFSQGKGRVSSVSFIPSAALNGTDTDSATLNVKLADGTVIATQAFVATPATNIAAHAKGVIPVTGTAAQCTLAIGGTIYVEKAKVGNGLATPLGTVVIGWKPVGG